MLYFFRLWRFNPLFTRGGIIPCSEVVALFLIQTNWLSYPFFRNGGLSLAQEWWSYPLFRSGRPYPLFRSGGVVSYSEVEVFSLIETKWWPYPLSSI